MLIRNYGLFWSEAKVFWGRPNSEGTLLGVPRRLITSLPVDFRQQIGIYVLYDNYRSVNVGQAGAGVNSNLFSRLKDHRTDHLAGRWDMFSWFGVVPVNDVNKKLRQNFRINPKLEDVLDHIEAILITAMEPVLNRQGGKFGDAEEYLQYDDKRLPDDLGTIANQILDRLGKLERAKK